MGFRKETIFYAYIEERFCPTYPKLLASSFKKRESLIVEYSWHNPLLYSKRAGTFDQSDLDAYDSELAQDLYAIHDTILNNPVRDYNPMSIYSEKRYFNFTFNALKNKLLPAVEAAAATLIGREGYVDSYIRTAGAELRKAERWGETEDYATAAANLETAFSALHSAIDRIRYATREVPKVRSLKPVHAAKNLEYRLWVYDGERVREDTASNLGNAHMKLMEKHGLPTSGRGFDAIPRGQATVIGDTIFLYSQYHKIPSEVYDYYVTAYPHKSVELSSLMEGVH